MAIDDAVELRQRVAHTHPGLRVGRTIPQEADETATRDALALRETQAGQQPARFSSARQNISPAGGDRPHGADEINSRQRPRQPLSRIRRSDEVCRRAKIRSHRLALSERLRSHSEKPSRAPVSLATLPRLNIIVAAPGSRCHLLQVRKRQTLLLPDLPTRAAATDTTSISRAAKLTMPPEILRQIPRVVSDRGLRGSIMGIAAIDGRCGPRDRAYGDDLPGTLPLHDRAAPRT